MSFALLGFGGVVYRSFVEFWWSCVRCALARGLFVLVGLRIIRLFGFGMGCALLNLSVLVWWCAVLFGKTARCS